MRGIRLAENLPYKNLPQIVDITDKLPKKAAWEDIKDKRWTVKGHWDGKTYCNGFRKPSDIDTIVIHHSGPPDGGTLESHARFHRDKWGAGIAYHVAVDNGGIFQLNDLLSMTYHSGGNNTYTVGILINRDLTHSGDLTIRERELLYAAIMSVKAVLPIREIKGHRELPTCHTACPATSEDRIRKDIFALEQQIEKENSPMKRSETAYMMMNQFQYYYNMFALGKTSSGQEATQQQREWALAEVLKLEPEMRRLGMLK